MNYTLHKLPEGFIVTSHEEIKEGDLVHHTFGIHKAVYKNGILGWISDKTKAHLYFGTEGGGKVIAQQDQIDFSFLSKEEQKEIEWFDVEELALNETSDIDNSQFDRGVVYGFHKGFKKAQELLSDRRFTLEDMRKAFNAGDTYRYYENGGFRNIPSDILDEEQYIQSLSQPKSWKVELEMENCTASALL